MAKAPRAHKAEIPKAPVALDTPEPAAPTPVPETEYPPPKLRPLEQAEARAVFDLLQKNADTAGFPIENFAFDEFMETVWNQHRGYAYEAEGAIRAVVSIALRDGHSRSAELGIVALEPGAGFGSAAFMAAVRFAFRTLGLARIFCIVNEDNQRMLKMMKGMEIWEHEGTFRSSRMKGGKVYDQHCFSILSREMEKWDNSEGG